MPGNIRLWGTSGYVELAAPSTAANQVLTLPTDSVQPALVLITTQSFSAISSLSVNNCFSSTYQNYRIVVDYIGTNSGTVNPQFRFRSNGIDLSTAIYYEHALYNASSSSAPAGAYTPTSTFWAVGNIGDNASCSIIDLFNPYVAKNKTQLSTNVGSGSSTAYYATRGGFCINQGIYDGFSLTPASGSMTGTLRVYGYRS